MEPAEEQLLLSRLKKDPEAFGVLFDAYYEPILGYVLKRVAHLASAQDITSDVFYKALKHIRFFQWRKISFKVWLYRIAHNAIVDWYRSKKCLSLDELRERTGFDVTATRDTENIDYPPTWFTARLAQRCIADLPERYQAAIVLKYFEKKKINEIAEILGKKEGTVKSLISRGLDKLKIIIENDPLFKSNADTW